MAPSITDCNLENLSSVKIEKGGKCASKIKTFLSDPKHFEQQCFGKCK